MGNIEEDVGFKLPGFLKYFIPVIGPGLLARDLLKKLMGDKETKKRIAQRIRDEQKKKGRGLTDTERKAIIKDEVQKSKHAKEIEKKAQQQKKTKKTSSKKSSKKKGVKFEVEDDVGALPAVLIPLVIGLVVDFLNKKMKAEGLDKFVNLQNLPESELNELEKTAETQAKQEGVITTTTAPIYKKPVFWIGTAGAVVFLGMMYMFIRSKKSVGDEVGGIDLAEMFPGLTPVNELMNFVPATDSEVGAWLEKR